MAVNTNKADIFINSWNEEFPEQQLTLEDLKKPHSLFGALFKIFDRLGVDKDAVLLPPTENDLNDDIVHYYDLLPFINITRVINHLVSLMPQFATVTVNHFLQPTVAASHSILLLLFNFMLFIEQQLNRIAPLEDELFNLPDMLKSLEEQKQNLLEQMNIQAEEMGKCSEKKDQYEREIQLLEEELKAEEEAYNLESRELENIIKEKEMVQMSLEQKKATKEGLINERERKKALRVYDADDIKAKAAQAARNVKEVEEKLNSLKAFIIEKENSLKILQMTTPNLDAANNLLHEIRNSLDANVGDLGEDSKEGELEMMKTEIVELSALKDEAVAQHEAAARKHWDAVAKRQHDMMLADNTQRDAEKADKKRREYVTAAVQQKQEIMERTLVFKEQNTKGIATIQQQQEIFINNIRTYQEALRNLIIALHVKMDKLQ